MTDSKISDSIASNMASMIGPIMAASVLVSAMNGLKKAWERQFIERVCIGGPMD